MLKLELLEPIKRNDEKHFISLKYILFNDENKKSLIMRTSLYDNNATTTYVFDFKKNFVNAEVETYLGCSIKPWKQLLLNLRDGFNDKTNEATLEGIFDKIMENLNFKVPSWLKAEWLVAQYVNGYMVEEGNVGYDVVDKDGIRYQVKTKRLFDDNRQYGTRGAIEFKTPASLEFDYLIVVGITEIGKAVVEARMWTKDQVKERMGLTSSFSISNRSKFETGKQINILKNRNFEE